jgi:hypothetical protein
MAGVKVKLVNELHSILLETGSQSLCAESERTGDTLLPTWRERRFLWPAWHVDRKNVPPTTMFQRTVNPTH